MSGTRELVVAYTRLLLRAFFRRIEVSGLENVPTEGGGLLISWHPNGTIDASVLLAHFPRRVIFGARHGLFNVPVFGRMMRLVGAVPIYRHRDMTDGASDEERRASNRRSIDALAKAVAEGGFSALFPEGRSHDQPYIHQLKTGAAHLYYRACELADGGGPRPVIIPVGLHYTKKSIWGSQVLVTFHTPLDLPSELALPSPDGSERAEQARRLTAEFDRVLESVILATESWDLHHLLQRGRKLIRAEGHARRGTRSEPPGMSERVRHFGRIWKNYRKAIETHSRETRSLLASVAFYDRCLRALRVEDHELDGASWGLSIRRTVLVIAQFLVVYLVLPVFLVIGALVNLPTMLLLQAFTKLAARKYKDEASIKIFVGALLFPLTWLVIAVLVAWGGGTLAAAYPGFHYRPVLTGILAFVLSAFGGVLTLQFRELATEAYRTLRVRLTLSKRRHAVEWLREERSRLFDRLLELDRELAEPPREATAPTSSGEESPRFSG